MGKKKKAHRKKVEARNKKISEKRNQLRNRLRKELAEKIKQEQIEKGEIPADAEVQVESVTEIVNQNDTIEDV